MRNQTQRVVLVEDDSSITRFVQLALDALPIDLITCSSVKDALAAQQKGNARLFITDLMLQGESGLELVHHLINEPAHAQGARVAVFSAGLTPAVHSQLIGMGVWRVLAKPATIEQLQDCVRDALLLESYIHAPSTPSSPSERCPEEAHAIATHFAGNEKLFLIYQTQCHYQFIKDIEQGDAAVHTQDWAALRRLAHNLGTVLLTLGKAHESAIARRIENTATAQIADECEHLWPQLKARLAAI